MKQASVNMFRYLYLPKLYLNMFHVRLIANLVLLNKLLLT